MIGAEREVFVRLRDGRASYARCYGALPITCPERVRIVSDNLVPASGDEQGRDGAGQVAETPNKPPCLPRT
ncbi:hypothetical protein STENM327S_05067 [Streptomyces tendae]